MSRIRETKLILSKIKFNLNELNDLIDERLNILDLNLQPSKNDDFELINNLQNIVKNFKLIEEININNDVDNLLLSQFKSYINQYNSLYNKLINDSTIEISEYQFEYKEKSVMKKDEILIKSVRFKDNPDKEDDDDEEEEVEVVNNNNIDNTNASQLMGTNINNINTFKPYKDEPEDEVESRNNHQLFAQHQQTMMNQDEDLNLLHQSINRQHLMSQDINSEIDDHLIILNDLESGIENSQSNLQLANKRLNKFRQITKENGSLITIIILTIILILLLIVLN
ncbi:unnamed protein product [Candida verbasci]|uniref:t-SNARE coiled-coil homology domain-containing protein n=1 Tax=Candida verbasci TaxID=1227364 RepID=A0A9W4XBI8_9ASCO|nr:unnamed protein product [Candida verbasci]